MRQKWNNILQDKVKEIQVHQKINIHPMFHQLQNYLKIDKRIIIHYIVENKSLFSKIWLTSIIVL